MSNNCKRFSMRGMRSKAIITPTIRWRDVIQLMAKKQKKSKRHHIGNAGRTAPAAATAIIRRRPEIPAFWIAIIIPIICLVGAWTYPPAATPMELKSYASQIYLSGLLFLWFWLQRKQPTFTLTFSPVRLSLVILFLFGTLSLIWAANPDFWVYKWNKWYAALSIFILGYQVTQTEKNLDTIVKLTIVGGLIVATIGIAQHLFGLELIPQTSRPSSTFGNGNMAGQVMVLTALLPLHFIFKEKLSTNKAWFYAFSLSILATYSFYTRTRAIWIAYGLETVLVLAFIILDRKNRGNWLFWNKEKAIAMTTAALLFLLLINFNGQGFLPFWEVAIDELSSIAISVNSSAAEGEPRYLIWTSVAEMIKDSPFIGTGLGSFFEVYNTAGYANPAILGVQRVHNDVLELFVEIGAIGILIFIFIIVTMCILLYRLILNCDGYKRLLFALLTIQVTGSMLNAQVSFPYQLPVPLVIMPLLLALIIKGSEDIESNTFSLSLKPWFSKLVTPLTLIIFVFVTVNDLLWYRDIHILNRILREQKINTMWQPTNPIYNQVYITAARSIHEAYKNENSGLFIQNIVNPVVEYWPDVLAHQTMSAQNFLKQGNFEQAEYWALKMAESQMSGYYFSEFFLMDIYQRTGDAEKYLKIYEKLKINPESSLRKHSNTYNMLHSMSINLRDYEMTTHYFDKYLEYFGEFAPVLANQAVFYLNNGLVAEAIPLMRRSLELDPSLSLAGQFQQIMAQYPDL